MINTTRCINKLITLLNEHNIPYILDESQWCLTFKSQGTTKVVVGTNMGLNQTSAAVLAKDKAMTISILKKNGINTVHSQLFFDSETALSQQFEYPVIIKPNKSFGGDSVFQIDSHQQLLCNVKKVFEKHDQVVIEKMERLREFRFLVFDNEIYGVFEKQFAVLRGDGKSTVKELVEALSKKGHSHEDEAIRRLRIEQGVKRHNLKLTDILENGHEVKYLNSKNLSDGASAKDVTKECHQKYKDLAIQCANTIGLHYTGVDIFISDHKIFTDDHKVLEINSNPGLKTLSANPEQYDKLYRTIFLHLTGKKRQGGRSPN